MKYISFIAGIVCLLLTYNIHETDSLFAQNAARKQAESTAKKSDEKKLSAGPEAAAMRQEKEQPSDRDGKLLLPQHRDPLQLGVNIRSITLRSFVDYNQIDFGSGVFLPAGDLADGMDYAYFFRVNIKTPFTHLVLPSTLGDSASFFRWFDVGLHFSFIKGKSSKNDTDEIVFAPLLLDIYYNLPFDIGRFKVFVFNGIGASMASTVVVRNSDTVHEQSFALTIRPGIGADFFFTSRVYARLDAAYFMCFESITGMGVIVSAGVGYLY